jgi:hypothetical protein
MKLSELIAKVGDENVKFQNLDLDIVKAGITSAGGQICFATDERHVIERTQTESATSYLGLVLWIPRNKLPPEFK